MQLTPLKLAIAAAWLLVVFMAAFAMPVITVAGWLTTIGFTFVPFVFLLRAWRRPAQTLSETIQAEIRRPPRSRL